MARATLKGYNDRAVSMVETTVMKRSMGKRWPSLILGLIVSVIALAYLLRRDLSGVKDELLHAHYWAVIPCLGVSLFGLWLRSLRWRVLLNGRIAGAGLDVFGQEPPDPKLPVYQLPNVVVTPHVSGGTDGTARKRAAAAAENTDRIAQGLEPLYRVDQV